MVSDGKIVSVLLGGILVSSNRNAPILPPSSALTDMNSFPEVFLEFSLQSVPLGSSHSVKLPYEVPSSPHSPLFPTQAANNASTEQGAWDPLCKHLVLFCLDLDSIHTPIFHSLPEATFSLSKI